MSLTYLRYSMPVCLYDDKSYIGIMMDRCNGNNDIKVKFMR